MRYLLILLFSAHAFAGSKFDLDNAPTSEIRLRLGDPVQELLTTSVNWPDLKAPEILSQRVAAVTEEKPAPVLKVFVDIGHGGKDYGARGQSGLYEKELCLQVGRLVQKQLNQLHSGDLPRFEILLSRDRDHFLGLRERTHKANEWGADLFVSIHANAAESIKPSGFEVYFLSSRPTDFEARKLAKAENDTTADATPNSEVLNMLSDAVTTYHLERSSRFAESMYRAMSKKLQPNRRSVRQAPFTVLSGAMMPAILVEIGYVSNPRELILLHNGGYLKRLAGAISNGILDFLLTLGPGQGKVG